jgi:hypothetical protein
MQVLTGYRICFFGYYFSNSVFAVSTTAREVQWLDFVFSCYKSVAGFQLSKQNETKHKGTVLKQSHCSFD